MRTNNNYVTIDAWLRDALKQEKSDVVLSHASALEYQGLFGGFIHEATIDVYAKEKGRNPQINYHIVDSYDDLEIITDELKTRYTSLSQTINDMLDESYDADDQPLAEALANYYHNDNRHNFDGIIIAVKNLPRFNSVYKDWAIDYYND